MDYPPSKLLNNDLNNIVFEEDTTIFVCLYKIHFLNNKPYIQYLLYKQNINSDNICSFLYCHFKNNKSFTLEYINRILDELSFKKIDFKGYLQNNLHFYFFYEITEDYDIYKYNNGTILFWASIYEIVQMQKILNIPIHSSVFLLFYSNKQLTYLQESNEIPMIIYSKKSFIEFISNDDDDGNIVIQRDENIKDCENIIRYIFFITTEFNNISHFLIKNITQLKILSE